MGNLCGKHSKTSDDPFQYPGRTLGSAPPPSQPSSAPIPSNIKTDNGRTLGSAPPHSQQTRASIPSGIKSDTGAGVGGGRTLGGNSGGGGVNGGGEDAARAAARAAEERAALASGGAKGKLGKALQKERARTNSDHLAEGSRDVRRGRDVDGVGEVRRYN